MDVSKFPLLKGDARRQLEKWDRIVEFGNYALAWYTGDCATLCGPCAAEALAEYIKHHDDEEFCGWYDGELPEDCGNVEEGPPVFCDECNRVIFEGYEECEKCGTWESTPDLTYYTFEHSVPIRELDEQFPDDEYGRRALHLASDSQDLEYWYAETGLCAEEQVFGCLFVAHDLGDLRDEPQLVGVFGCDRFIPTIYAVLTTIWANGELTLPYKEAAKWWALSECERENFEFPE
jgi:hypothetical protein